MAIDFDKVINRKGTHSLKYDFATVRGKKADILPLWVADMDFQAPKAVRERLFEIVEHGIFGYSDTLEDYFRAVKSWYKRRFDWEIESDWIIKTPGIVFALAMAVKAYTEPGESVLMLQPVYYPFREVVEDNGRKLIGSPLKLEDGHYTIDFEDMEKKIRENDVKLLLFCSPHNPVGRVWKREELEKVAALCLKYHMTLVSDEIHSDIVYKGHKHQMMASISEEIADITVTCTAPSKTFNVAGLQLSNIIISNPKLREKFKHEVMQAGYSQPNLMGMEACQAAYENGEEWLEELLVYLQGNVDFVRDYLKQEIFVGEDLYVFEAEDAGEILNWHGEDNSSAGEYITGLIRNRMSGGNITAVTLRELFYEKYKEDKILRLPIVKIRNGSLEVEV